MSMLPLSEPASPFNCLNFSAGRFTAGLGGERAIVSPYTGTTIARLHLSTVGDVDAAVQAAANVWPAWSQMPLAERLTPLRRLRELLLTSLDSLANGIALESGKLPAEARAGLLRGLEVIDYALSLQNMDTGAALEVSRGVSCEYRRQALGVVVGITPFNFPAMVPLWMMPLALTLGNCFILKPSEKVPVTACRLAELLAEAGYPAGVFSVVHGDATAARALVVHPLVRAVGFVGSTAAARDLYSLAGAEGKRALCLGGAKNWIIAAADADPEFTAKAVVDSFTGCAGQRCMAASILAIVGPGEKLLDAIAARARDLRLGSTLGALIDAAARTRLLAAIERAEHDGASVLLDGRGAAIPEAYPGGQWLGPTILDRCKPDMQCAREELFGPVLSVLRVNDLEAALDIEQQNPYGNALAVFTASGGTARRVRERSRAGMVGVNVGVPVPREPFSFGGTKLSKFGHGDITGPSSIDFWTDLKKVTTKWQEQTDGTWMS
jgi:malonate-semialdehyde dehydrogenase (acetylating) / methylmalonate-semialdehyde dehydrogenase